MKDIGKQTRFFVLGFFKRLGRLVLSLIKSHAIYCNTVRDDNRQSCGGMRYTRMTDADVGDENEGTAVPRYNESTSAGVPGGPAAPNSAEMVNGK